MGNLTKQEYGAGNIIFKEGDEGKHLCQILSGTVEIYKDYGDKNEKKLTVLGAGAYFGEMGLIEKLPRSATAVAATECELLLISEEEFAAYMQDNSEVALKIMKTLSNRLRTLTSDFMEACGTIAESLEEDEKRKSKTLMGRLKKFAQLYNESCQELAMAERMDATWGFYNNYHGWS